MSNPNIVNVTSILGFTTAIIGGTSATTFLSNTSGSNKVIKVNTVMAANIDGTSNVDITVKYHTSAAGAGTSIPLASTVTVPADATLVVIGKENPIYIEEDRSLTAEASAADDVAIICSYEEIS